MMASMKMAVFWVVAPCSLVEVTDVSEVLAASIIREMSHCPDNEAASISETLLTSIRLHGATTQKTAIFLASVSL
jgi:hypothetical protein